jgi:3-methylcrotonyl-CoA carboxylase alpha subunit
MTKIVTIAGQSYELTVEREGQTLRSGDAAIELVELRPREAEIRVAGRTHFVPYVIEGTTVSFAFDGEIYAAEVTEKGSRPRGKHRNHSLAAPMPGLVLKILTTVGAVVSKGAPLVILEAMKMEHQIVAPYDGTVTAIQCKEGEMVQPGFDLIDLERTSS